MIVHAYVVCKNEIEFLPFFTNYYEGIIDRVFVYDNDSTDGSIDFIQQHSLCTLMKYNTHNELRDDIHMWIKNSVWKESRGIADWVIVSDLDELLYHPHLKEYLAECKRKGVTIPKTVGFNMISDSFPVAGKKITEQIRYGAYSKKFTKSVVFDPNKIEEINFSPGGHSIEPVGKIVYKKSQGLKLLHYKYLGPLERLQKRWDNTGKELSKINLEKRWGVERQKSAEILKRFNYVKHHAEIVVHEGTFTLREKLLSFFKIRDRNPYI